MGIYAPHGTKVKFVKDTQGWGCPPNNNRGLELGSVYTVDYTKVHSFHTDVYLVEFPGRWFSSVCFEEVQ